MSYLGPLKWNIQRNANFNQLKRNAFNEIKIIIKPAAVYSLKQFHYDQHINELFHGESLQPHGAALRLVSISVFKPVATSRLSSVCRLKTQYMFRKWKLKCGRKTSSTKINPSWIYPTHICAVGHLSDIPTSAGQQVMSNPLVLVVFARHSWHWGFHHWFHWVPQGLVMFPPVTSGHLQPFTVCLSYQRVRWSTYRVCLFPLLMKSHNPTWISLLKVVYDLFTSSSGKVFLWNSAKVPALQRLVNGKNKGVNHLSHIRSERVKRGSLSPWTFEVSVLVALRAEQPLLGHGDV